MSDPKTTAEDGEELLEKERHLRQDVPHTREVEKQLERLRCKDFPRILRVLLDERKGLIWDSRRETLARFYWWLLDKEGKREPVSDAWPKVDEFLGGKQP